jgi:miniconductance mechanosensitive channel
MDDATASFSVGDLMTAHPLVANATGVLVLLVVCLASHVAAVRLVAPLVRRLVGRTDATWDDLLLNDRVLAAAAWIVPTLVAAKLTPVVPGIGPAVAAVIVNVASAATALVAAHVVCGLLTGLNAIYQRRPDAELRPIKSYIQVLQLVAWIVGGVVAIAALLDQSPAILLSGIGAVMAILLLIFKDTILSLVAAIQVSSYDLVRLGDWLEAPQFGADGDVIDIGLHTVKILNWDKTITTIPTYKLVDGSFKNWRGMTESGGRRIKRTLDIDLASVRFLTEEEMDRHGRLALLADYMADKRRTLAEHNARVAERTPGLVPNARRLTNLGTFRAYIAAYLRGRGDIREDMTFLVRHLAPTPTGLPIEIYCFTNTVRWDEYEGIQADVFDHLLATVPTFDLRVFQQPSGADVTALAAALRQGPGVRTPGGPG